KDWLARNARGAETVAVKVDAIGDGVVRARYRGRMLRYVGHWMGREGEPIEAVAFVSGEDGKPVFADAAREFAVELGKTKINPGLDGVIARMKSGERKTVAIPAELAYGRSGYYAPEIPGMRRLVISPGAMVVYEVELSRN